MMETPRSELEVYLEERVRALEAALRESQAQERFLAERLNYYLGG